MFPVLFQIPAFPAWVAAALCFVLGGLFAWLGRRDAKDRGSLWLAGACAVGGIALLAAFGTSGTVGPLPIRMFGILVVLGFLAATKVVAARNRRLDLLGGDETFDMMFYVLLAGIAGARLVHVLQNSDEFAGQPQKILKIWDGGLVWYGGALGGVLYAWWWLAKRGKDLWSVTDSVALAAPLGHAVGRLGCFSAGCDYGRKVALEEGQAAPWWAVHFPVREPGKEDFCLVPEEFREDLVTGDPVYVHPVQLYLALFNLATFAILFVLDRRATKGAFPGRLTATYLMTYAVGRSALETFRGDADRGVYFGGTLSFSQLVSILVFASGLVLWRVLRSRAAARARTA
jgi:phosphatidylglycerol:prolipoprotein diacylglycerol transferase